MDFSLTTIVLWGVPVVLAITLHEAAHGYIAKLFGDRTAEMLGRVTLNPVKHVDPVGTILVPGILLLTAKLAGGVPFIFGWAKPVPVNAENLRHPRRDMVWVAIAGPGSNFVQALLWAVLLVIAAAGGAVASAGLSEMARIGVTVNLVLMALNILPIPPLDGGRVLASLSRVEPLGLFVILGLLVTGLLDNLMRPLIVGAQRLIVALVSLV